MYVLSPEVAIGALRSVGPGSIPEKSPRRLGTLSVEIGANADCGSIEAATVAAVIRVIITMAPKTGVLFMMLLLKP